MNGDIEIEIAAGSGAGRYAVRVIRSAAGGEPSATLDLDVEELLGSRGMLESVLLASAVPRRSVSAGEQPVREVGRRLFEALFTGPVYGMYRASAATAQQRGRRLRVVLRLTAPELAAVPWEMLFDPETGTYLCRQEPLVRHVPAPYTADPVEVRLPLRVLGLVASPRGLPPLDVETEKHHLAEALAEPLAAGLIEVVWVSEATWHGVQARLLAGEWHVLHFVGHGDYDTRTDEGVLALLGADGRADLVEASRLADLLGQAQPTPQLVVLNSCASGQSGVTDLFSGTAAALVRSGISAVAAMQFTVSDTAAIAFARGFYTAIAHGRTVDEAAHSGRIAILGTRSLEWVTPVLYVRGQATKLFTLTAPPAGSRDAPPAHQDTAETGPPAAQAADAARRRQAELRALFIQASAELRVGRFEAAISLLDDLLILDAAYEGAAALREDARRGLQLAGAYAMATAAQDAGDWAAAARQYGEILQADRGYRDAAARKAACEARQKVADLQAELRHHASTGQWQAVMAVDAELTGLDPSSADPDGQTTRARAALAAEQLAADLDDRYARARAAEAEGDWAGAARGYDDILNLDPAYQDAAARRDRCQQRGRADGLQAKLDQQAAAGDWPQVLTTIAELAELDPAAAVQPSYSELAARARRQLAAHPSQPLLRIDTGETVNALAWHPGGGRIAVGNSGAFTRVYDIAGEEPRQQLAVKASSWHSGTLQVVFSADGTKLATVGGNKLARVWDAATGDELLEVSHDKWVKAVAFSPDGTKLATRSRDGTARVWDTATGEKLTEVSADVNALGQAVAFSPDSTKLATGSNWTARIWDADTGDELLQVTINDRVTEVTFSPDGTKLATFGARRLARIWDAATGDKLLEVSHDKWIAAVAFSPDGTKLATGGDDKTARIWDMATGDKLLQVRHDRQDGSVRAVAFSADGTKLATGTLHQIVLVWPVPGM